MKNHFPSTNPSVSVWAELYPPTMLVNDNEELKTWKILRIKYKYEKNVEHALKKLGIEVYLPVTVEMRQWSDRKKKVIVPLFPGYLFCRINVFEKVQVIDCQGVIDFVRVDGCSRASIIANEEIEFIRSLENGDPQAYNDDFSKGDEIIVTNGPFRGLRGTLIKRKNSRRLIVNVAIINQSMTVDISPYNTEKIPYSHSMIS